MSHMAPLIGQVVPKAGIAKISQVLSTFSTLQGGPDNHFWSFLMIYLGPGKESKMIRNGQPDRPGVLKMIILQQISTSRAFSSTRPPPSNQSMSHMAPLIGQVVPKAGLATISNVLSAFSTLQGGPDDHFWFWSFIWGQENDRKWSAMISRAVLER